MPDAPRKLRELLTQPGALAAPGACDAISALLIQQAGFDVVYVTGGGVARSMGYPDVGLVTFNEMLARVEEVTRTCSLPVIADADTGYGNAVNVRRTVYAYERAGAAGLHIEDQVFPKRCGHYEGQTLIPTEEMAGKIEAACATRTDPNFLIIARTDARSAGSIENSITRAQRYIQAGADAIFVEAPRTEEEVREAAARLDTILVYNMTDSGKSPMLPLKNLAEIGYRIVLFPSQAQRAALLAMQRVLADIRASGRLPDASQMLSFEARDALIGHADYIEWEDRFVR